MPVRLTPEAGAARDVDDAPVPAALHARRHRLGAEEGAGEVDGDDRLPVGLGDLLERPADLTQHAARIVDEDVDGAAGALGRGNEVAGPPRDR